ncbi:hypothetical protein BLOT_015906 [Blomia tropicalis]|nr:hypothetical protein BLOT_015906 [Blomia tropicalis]
MQQANPIEPEPSVGTTKQTMHTCTVNLASELVDVDGGGFDAIETGWISDEIATPPSREKERDDRSRVNTH